MRCCLGRREVTVLDRSRIVANMVFVAVGWSSSSCRGGWRVAVGGRAEVIASSSSSSVGGVVRWQRGD
eukprot:scaffold2031_cov185-Alexandrium_tamarense.AAC.21